LKENKKVSGIIIQVKPRSSPGLKHTDEKTIIPPE
jgi:hypothetical protein